MKPNLSEDHFHHTTRDGRRIKLRDLELSHLHNIIKHIERRATEGVVVMEGGGPSDEEAWYEEEVLSYEDGLEYLNHDVYVRELKRRAGDGTISAE